MNIKERELYKKYRYSKLSYVFDIYCEFEYRANLTGENKEVDFSYTTWKERLGYSRKQIQRALKELEAEGFIKWVYKSNSKAKKSIIYLCE